MVVIMIDIIDELGFKWNGVCYTCGFYRIKNRMGTYCLERYSGYKNRRVQYSTINSLYTTNITYSWFDVEVNEQKFNNFKNSIIKSVRDTKLKRLNGFFKHEEEYYSSLHCRS